MVFTKKKYVNLLTPIKPSKKYVHLLVGLINNTMGKVGHLHPIYQWLTKDKNCFQREGKGGKDRTWPSRGREIMRKLRQVCKSGQNCVNHIFFQKNLLLPFKGCYTVFLWPWFIIYMLTSFTGYAYDIFDVI